MRLVTYNIQYGFGRDGRLDLDRIAGELAGADLIALQEVERHNPRSDGADQPAELARKLGDYWWVYGAGVDLHAPGGTPADSGVRRAQFGNMLLSRSPILSSRNHLLPKYASTGPLSIQRGALEGVVETSQGPVRFYSVHLTHVSAQTRLPQIDTLLRIHAQARTEGGAVTGAGAEGYGGGTAPPELGGLAVIMGDFNSTPDSAEYERMAGPVSPYGGRVSNPEGFVDAWVEAGNEVMSGTTSDVLGALVRLDYCFVSTRLAGCVRSARVDDDATGSDHLPVWIDFDV